MSIIQGTGRGGARGLYDFPIEQSLRFDGSSYLSRTPTTAGNRKTWTWSGWVKRGNIGSYKMLFNNFNGSPYTNEYLGVYFENDSLRLYARDSSLNTVGRMYSAQLFRDTSAWYHLVLVVDTTNATSTDRLQMYVNGTRVTSFDGTFTTPSLNSDLGWNLARQEWFGTASDGNPFDGYMSEVQFIDGQALDQYFFGEFKDNIWVPYNAFSTAGSGTATASDGDTANDYYGTNGFHLTFEDGIESLPVGGYTGNQNAFRDKSHNTNHWKTN